MLVKCGPYPKDWCLQKRIEMEIHEEIDDNGDREWNDATLRKGKSMIIVITRS